LFEWAMKVNIIGGNGLVGSGIAEFLSKSHSVKVFGSSDFDDATFKFKKSEVFDCDLFIHAAGVTDELVVDDYDLSVFKSNNFIKYIIDSLAETSCSKVVYISTIHVFGNLSKKLGESTSCSPKSIYALLHFSAEKTFEILVRKTSMSYLGLRIPTIYGFPRDRSRVTRPSIIQFAFPLAVKKNNGITLKSSGDQYRLFASNYKVGGIIAEWVSDTRKNTITTDVVQGVNITVKNFAKLCIQICAGVDSHEPSLVIDADQLEKNSHQKIEVISKYDCSEIYSINQFLVDFSTRHFG
jgi:nucleoside-diphosphate-sugar epimerase